MEIPRPSQPEQPLGNHAEIKKITTEDKNAFSAWASQPANRFALNFPSSALRYFIPERILELSDDPRTVNVANMRPGHNMANILIYERKKEPVSDPEQLAKWLDAITAKEVIERDMSGWETYMFTPPKAPEGIDDYHVEKYRLIRAGVITAHDFVHIDTSIDNTHGDLSHVLNVAEYTDRQEFHGKGIGKSFYKRLQEIARDLGFRYITGSNNEENIDFFTNIIGRTPLSEIKDDLQANFDIYVGRGRKELFTVDFLYQKDKEIYRKKRE